MTSRLLPVDQRPGGGRSDAGAAETDLHDARKTGATDSADIRESNIRDAGLRSERPGLDCDSAGGPRCLDIAQRYATDRCWEG